MQSGGQAAGIQLQVGLDLAFFRQQMQKVSAIAGSEFTARLDVRFNRQLLDAELNNLQRAIKKRIYRVEIGGNLSKLPGQVQKLKQQLASLEETKVDVGIGAVKSLSNRDAKKIATDLRAQVVQGKKKIYVGIGAIAALSGDEARKLATALREQITGAVKKIHVGIGAIKSLSNANAQQIADEIKAQIVGPKEAILVPVSIVPKITANDVAAFKDAAQEKLGAAALVSASIIPGIKASDIVAFKDAVKQKLAGIKVTIEVEAQASKVGAGVASVSEGRKRPAGYEAALESVSKLQVEQLRKRAFSSLGEESRAAQQVSNWLDTLVSQGLKGKPRTTQLTAIREFLADALATAAGKNIEARLQPLRGQTSTEATRSATNINKILDTIAQYTQRPEAAQQMLRMLPESRISTNTLAAASKQAGYYEAIPGAKAFQSEIKGFDPLLKSIAKDFTEYTKSLSSTNPWVGKISDGIARMVSSASVPLQTQKLLPAAGQSSASRMTQPMFAGLSSLQAPSIGQENGPKGRAATRALNNARQLLGLPIGPFSPLGSMGQFPMAGMVGPSSPLGSMGKFPVAGIAGRGSIGQFPTSGMAMPSSPLGSMGRFPLSGMAYPSSPLGVINAQSSMFAGGGPLKPPPGGPPRAPSGGGGGGLGGFGRALGSVNLPGKGVVLEIGEEFAMATKQVLLFGTAYKALAFLTSFPAQVGQAVGALQNFNNTLKAISPSAEEAKASNQFVLDIVERYNVPLQSARDGFTKLYASMAPAGFKGDEIRALFTGVSQAAATFGMSADKVDRVNYAFAQMASKGQVMSEELKGQLGDVLPGAMGIFAEAAGFEGPTAIEKFSKALEDGAYKGDAMRQLLKNVTVILTKEFGPGAEGAARTFQGVINRMQNSTKLLYEAFEPVAVGFLNSVVVPLTSGIRMIADGFSAFFKGVRAQTSGGFTIAQELEKLRPAFDGIRANVATLVPMLQTFGGALLEVSKIFLQIASNPFVGYLARIYLSALPAVAIIKALSVQALIPLIGNLLRAIPAFITFNSLMLQGDKAGLALKTTTMLLGSTTAATASQIRVMSTALKAAFTSTAVLAVVAGIGMIIEKMMSLSARLEEVRRKAMGAAESIRAMSQTEARQAANQAASDVKLIQGVSQRQQVAGYPGRIAVAPQEQAALERAGVTTQTTATRERGLNGFKQTVGITQLRGAIEKRQGDMREAEYRQRVEKFNAQQQALPTILPAVTSSGEKDQKEEDRRIRDASRLNQLIQQQLEAQNRLGLIGKDELSQIEAKAQLAKEILALTLKDIRLTETGAIQAQSITNATLAYQVTVAELNKEWGDVIKKIADVEKEGRGLYESILQQRNVEQSPLQKALIDIQDQAQNSIEKIDELLNSLAGQAGTRPEGLRARGVLGNLRTSLQERTPEQERLLASQKVTKTIKDDLEEQLQSLLDAGKTLTTLDEIIIKIGDDWGALSPQIQGDLAQLAGRIDAAKPFAEIASAIRESREELARMTSTSTLVVSSANSISDAFGTAFKGVITGSMTAREALAGFFQSLADSFADMVSKMIAEYMKMAIIKGITSLIPGLGSIGGGLGSSASNLDKYAPLIPMANGGVLSGGFQAFANGGIVTGPTLGLVGEGRYNEAVIPLPDGKSVPVDLGGAMGGNITSNIVVNVSSDGKMSSTGGGADAAGFGRKLEGAVKQVIAGELRPGGLLSKRN
jgi:tape measure domain-containing protein